MAGRFEVYPTKHGYGARLKSRNGEAVARVVDDTGVHPGRARDEFATAADARSRCELVFPAADGAPIVEVDQ